MPSTQGYNLFRALENGQVLIIEGGIHLTEHKYGDLHISGGSNAFALGNDNDIKQMVQGTPHQVPTEAFLKALSGSVIPKEKDMEIKEYVESITSEMKSNRPKKSVVSTMLGTINGIINTINATPELMQTFSDWHTHILSCI